jgi:ferredoxin
LTRNPSSPTIVSIAKNLERAAHVNESRLERKGKAMSSFADNPEEALTGEIKRFAVKELAKGNKKVHAVLNADDPLVGFADAADPLFSEFKGIIGDFHLTPMEILEHAFPEHAGSWNGASVISWVLPMSQASRESNRGEARYPSRLWSLTKAFTEEVNQLLMDHVVSFLKERGIRAVAPAKSPLFELLLDERIGFCANWSEKHVAYVAGLGTFGLSGALVTEKGVAVRLGSVVTDLKLKPTPRSYHSFKDHCLFYDSGECGECMERCPVGAISQEGQDKEVCLSHCAEVMSLKEYEDIDRPGCGKCQTAVPCESGQASSDTAK